MNYKILLAASLVSIALIATVIIADAQGPRPGGRRAPNALAGTGFTYQGQLKNSGALVNATCEFQFGLWDDSAAGAQVGATQTITSTVTNGLFTIELNASGQIASGTIFNGEARWVATSLRCPSGSGNYTVLNPRQRMTPAPMAFALPGMYTQENATSPNVIGGYSGNVISNTVVGGTIGGGGNSGNPNRVWASYATIAGGHGNTAAFAYSTIGGGSGNTTNNLYGTISGGALNTASGNSSTIAGGRLNIASGAGSFIGGGGYDGTTQNGNKAQAPASTISGGYSNTITSTASYATIGGGKLNNADSSSATVAGGVGNTGSGVVATVGGGTGNVSSGERATVAGGYYNTASGIFSTVPGGAESVASHYGEMAYASGIFSGTGAAQTSLYVMRIQTTNAITTEMFLDGATASQRITIANNRVLTFDILVVGTNINNGNSAGYRLAGVIKNIGGTTSFVGTPNQTVLGEDTSAWDAIVEADNTNDALVVKVVGAGTADIRWVASVRTAEVAY